MTARSDHLIERAAAKLRSGAEPQAEVPSAGKSSQHERGPFAPLKTDVSALLRDTAPGQKSVGQKSVGQKGVGQRDVGQTGVGLTGLGEAGVGQAGLPALAEPAPEIDLGALERAGLVVGRMARTRISEEFRIAVGRIIRLPNGSPASPRSNILMVTSAKPGEGKTFTALNLAAALAQSGPRRVVLADIDSKRNSLSEQLGLRPRRGILDLGGDPPIDARSLPVTTEVAGLSIVPTGAGPSEDSLSGHVRLLGHAVEQLAASLPERLLVLDTAPCLSTSDPSTLAGHVGHIVMVVEAESTQRNELEAAIDFVRACPVITILLNKTRLSTRHTFGTYDYLGSYQ